MLLEASRSTTLLCSTFHSIFFCSRQVRVGDIIGRQSSSTSRERKSRVDESEDATDEISCGVNEETQQHIGEEELSETGVISSGTTNSQEARQV